MGHWDHIQRERRSLFGKAKAASHFLTRLLHLSLQRLTELVEDGEPWLMQSPLLPRLQWVDLQVRLEPLISLRALKQELQLFATALVY